MTLKSHAKVEENDMEYGRFSPEHTKFSKLGVSLDPFIQSRKCMSLKLAGELYFMTIKNLLARSKLT